MTFLRNAWYCVGWATQLGTQPTAITVMDEPIMLTRLAGKAVALSDRCPHRFAPLSLGKVQGDLIECRYHGLRFDAQGICRLNPHGGAIPKAARVKSYPLAERDGMLWIWMGAQGRANESELPHLTHFLDPANHAIGYGYFKLGAHCELVIDNLMDLSHAPYLHAGSLSNGASDAQLMRVETRQDGNTVLAYHRLDGVPPTPQFQPFWKSASPVGDFRANMQWDPPCNLRLDVGITEPGHTAAEGLYIHMVHLLTPASRNETHYFWAAARNYGIGDEHFHSIVQQLITNAFTNEDEPMIRAVQNRMGDADLFSLKPVLLRADAAGVRVRRILEKLRNAERESHHHLDAASRG